MEIDPMRAIALILIGSFAVDRIVAGLFFLLSYSSDLRKSLDPSAVKDPEKQAEATRNYRLLYAIFGGYLGTVVMAGYMHIRLFASTDVPGSEFIGQYPLLDIFLTGLVLLGGADRLGEVLRMLGSSGAPEKKEAPLEIKGKLILEQSTAHGENALKSS